VRLLPAVGLLALVAVVGTAGTASATTDPAGDVARCPGLNAGRLEDAPDLIDAVGEVIELGTSVRWTLTFARPLQVPDASGTPFRVDVVLYDPKAPTVSFGYYHGVNRLLRYDAVADPVLVTLLLPERGESRFIAPEVDGATMTVRIPGRALTEDEDETGTSPGLDALRWGVITRDGAACDLLGSGRPHERLVSVGSATAAPPAADDADRGIGGRGVSGRGIGGWLVWVVAIALVGAIAIAGERSRRSSSRR
jgi:hypothetical protein